MDRPDFSREHLSALADDSEFQRRIAADVELNRLFNPALADSEIRLESFRSLGGGCRIAGVYLPPVTLGRFHLLVVVGNKFVQSKRTFQELCFDLPAALFILKHGAAAMAPFADIFSQIQDIERYKEDASKVPEVFEKLLQAHQACNEALLPWRRAVATFADVEICLVKGEDVEAAVGSLDALLAASLAGIDLLPANGLPMDDDGPKKKWWTRKRKQPLSPAPAKPAPPLPSTPPDGKSQW